MFYKILFHVNHYATIVLHGVMKIELIDYEALEETEFKYAFVVCCITVFLLISYLLSILWHSDGKLMYLRARFQPDVLYKEEFEVPILGLFVYPLKGCRGVQVDSIKVTPSGILYDREWCVVEKATGRVLDMANTPNLAKI